MCIVSPNWLLLIIMPGWVKVADFFALVLLGFAAAQPAWTAPQATTLTTAQAKPTAATPVFSIPSGIYTRPETVKITDSTPGAVVYYALHGVTPSTKSTKYTGPIKVSSTEKIEAIAVAAGYSNSVAAIAEYRIDELTAAAPAFSPPAGAYKVDQRVTITDAAPHASIYYTTDGTAPTTASTMYAQRILVSGKETVRAIAVAADYKPSAAASARYEITEQVATPVFRPGGGAHTAAQSVAISDATPGASIYYTTDGSAPTKDAKKYTGPIKVTNTDKIEAIAVAAGYINSAIATAIYLINSPTATPIFSPAGGTYAAAQKVAISDQTTGATIYYTTDGSIPTASSAKYTGAFSVSATETINAIARASGYKYSAVATATYTIDNAETGMVTTATFTPSTGFLSYLATGTVPGSGVPVNQSTVLGAGLISNPSTSNGAFNFVRTTLGSDLATPSNTTARSTLYFADQPKTSPMMLYAYGKSTTIDPAAKTAEIIFTSTPLSSITTPFTGGSLATAFLNNTNSANSTTGAVSMGASNSTAWNFYSTNQDGSLNATPKTYVNAAPAPTSNMTGTYSADIANANNTAVCAQWGTGSQAKDAVGCADQTGNATLKATAGMVPVKSAGTSVSTVIRAGTTPTATPSEKFSGSQTLWGVQAVSGGQIVRYATINGSGTGATVKTGTLTDANGASIVFGSIVTLANGLDESSIIVVDKAAGAKATDVQISQYGYTPTGSGGLSFSAPVTQTLPGLGGATTTVISVQNQNNVIVTPAAGLYAISNAGGTLGAPRKAPISVSGVTSIGLDADGDVLLAGPGGWGAFDANLNYISSSADVAGTVANPRAGSFQIFAPATP